MKSLKAHSTGKLMFLAAVGCVVGFLLFDGLAWPRRQLIADCDRLAAVVASSLPATATTDEGKKATPRRALRAAATVLRGDERKDIEPTPIGTEALKDRAFALGEALAALGRATRDLEEPLARADTFAAAQANVDKTLGEIRELCR